MVAQQKLWKVVLAVAAALLGAYLVAILTYRMTGAWGPYALDGDQGQAVWQYWRYHVDGALKPGHLLTDYAFVMHAPPAWWAMMASLSTFVEPLTAAKILQVVTFITLTLGAVFVVGSRTHWLLGIAAGFLVLRSPDLASTMAGGYARSFGPSLLLLFLGAFLYERHRLCLAILVLQAALYPSVVVCCGLTYGAYCVLRGPTMKDRLRRSAGMFVAGLMIIGFGLYQDIAAPDWWGKMVSYDVAKTMPAWQKGGRVPDTPHLDPVTHISLNAGRGFKPLGHTLAPESAQTFVKEHLNETMIGIPAVLALAAIAVDRLRRRRDGTVPDVDARFPWQLAALMGGSVVGYFVARHFAFKMYLPSRQLAHTIQYLVMMGLPILCWCGARAVFGNRKVPALVAAIGLSVAPAFIFRGDGLEISPYRYSDYGRDKTVWEFVRALPLDAQFACDGYWCEGIGVFAYHRPYAARNLTHPFRLGYYEEAERRLVEMHRALYANTLDEVVAFADREKIDYFIYNIERVKKPQPNIYRPAKEKIHKLWKEAHDRGPMVLEAPPEEAVIFRRASTVIIDITKLRELVNRP